MVSDEEMRTGNILNLFWKFTFPTIIGVLIAGIQGIIDGFFVGNAVGSEGLAGITLAYPPYLAIIGIGITIGIGSSTLVALELGKENKKGALGIVNNAFPLSLLAGAIFTIVGLIFCKTFIGVLGPGGPSLNFARDYLGVIFLGSVFMILTVALEPLVRNDGKPKLCTKIMVAGVIVNIVLDYLFVMHLKMGMSGAALATVISFALPALLFTYYLFGKEAKIKLRFKAMRLEIKTIFELLKAGLPSFVMQLSFAFVLFAHNYMLLKYGSELTVSAYGIIGYVFSIFYMLFEGIALGVQPIIGFNYGAGHYKRVSKTLKLTMLSCILIGAFGFLLIYLFPQYIVQIFSQNDPELLQTTLQGMNFIRFSLLVEGIVLLASIYYQSINRVKEALFINLGKVFVFLLPLLFILPVFFGLDGIWFAAPATEYIMLVIVLAMLSKEFQFLKTEKVKAIKAKHEKIDAKENSRLIPVRTIKGSEIS